jgi:hypothetical protein
MFQRTLASLLSFGQPCFWGMKMELLEAIHAAYDTIMQYVTVDFRFILVYCKGPIYKKGVRNCISKNACPLPSE